MVDATLTICMPKLVQDYPMHTFHTWSSLACVQVCKSKAQPLQLPNRAFRLMKVVLQLQDALMKACTLELFAVTSKLCAHSIVANVIQRTRLLL